LDLADSPFFAVLRANLHHLSQRQRLLSENIANAATPGYVPRDTDERSFDKALSQVGRQSAGAGAPTVMALTNPSHLAGARGADLVAQVIEAPDSETTLSGNSVVLEDEMMKEAETRTAYETSIALYQQGLSLVRLAIKAPGK